MNKELYDRQTYTLYVLDRKLKWYEKILQKIHIKNYYKRIGVGTLDKMEEIQDLKGDSKDE